MLFSVKFPCPENARPVNKSAIIFVADNVPWSYFAGCAPGHSPLSAAPQSTDLSLVDGVAPLIRWSQIMEYFHENNFSRCNQESSASMLLRHLVWGKILMHALICQTLFMKIWMKGPARTLLCASKLQSSHDVIFQYILHCNLFKFSQ
jgi:hypothetical protein